MTYARLLLVFVAFGLGWQVNGWRLERASLAAEIARAGQGLAKQAEIRKFEQAQAQRNMEVAHAVADEKARQARITASAVASADSLRDTLRLALAGHRSAEASAAACEDRAALAGELLARGLRVQAVLAGRAEDLAADYRGLRAAIDATD